MIRQPDMISKSLAIITITCLLIFIGITAYLVSALKAEINSDLFTISQALAFGNKPGMIILIICSLSVLSYLLYYRGHKYLYFRLLLNLIICVFIITIIWVTTYYSNTDHGILAGLIFTAFLISIILNSYLVYTGLIKKTKTKKIILLAIPILALIGFIGLIISNISTIDKNVVQLFPSFENYMCAIYSMSIFTLGFF